MVIDVSFRTGRSAADSEAWQRMHLLPLRIIAAVVVLAVVATACTSDTEPDASPSSAAPAPSQGGPPSAEQEGEVGWRLGSYLVRDGARSSIGEGLARTTSDGDVVAMDAITRVGNYETRVVVSEQGTFLGTDLGGHGGWIDLASGSGAGQAPPLPPLLAPDDDPVLTEQLDGQTFDVHVSGGPVTSDGVSTSATVFQTWVDDDGVARRLVTQTALSGPDGRLDVVTMADRDDAIEVDPGYVAVGKAVPVAAVLRRLEHLTADAPAVRDEPASGPTASGPAAQATLSGGSRFLAAPAVPAQQPAPEGSAGCRGRIVGVDQTEDGLRARVGDWECPPGVEEPRVDGIDLGEVRFGPPIALGDQPARDVEPPPLPRQSGRITVCRDALDVIADFFGWTYLGGATAVTLIAMVPALVAGGATVAAGALYIVSGAALIYIIVRTIDCWDTFLHGEPHITTVDGHDYDLQAAGEFVWLSSPQLTVQTRFEGTVGSVTWTTATAVDTGSHVVESYYDTAGPDSAADVTEGVPAVIDGRATTVDYTGVVLDDGSYVARQRGGLDDRNLLVVDPRGVWVRVENLNVSQNVLMGLPDGAGASTRGLAGTGDGDRTNDFTLRDGSVLGFAEARTIDGLYGRFASSWRVQPAERLFTAGDAQQYLTEDYTAVPQSVTSLADFAPDEVATAREQCRAQGVTDPAELEDCAYDLLAAGQEWAEQAGESAVGAQQPTARAVSDERVADDPLLLAADDCDLGVLTELLEDGADPNMRRADDGETPLRFAAQADCADGIEALIDAGADPDLANDEGATPLYLASSDGDAAVVRALLERGADADRALPSGDAPLLAASFDGHQEVVEALLEAGATTDVRRDEDGFTALLAAVQEGHRDVTQALLEAGASPDRTNAEGETALMVAADRDAVPLVELLAQAGAQLDRQRADDQATALHLAADDAPAAVDALLRAGADPDPADEDGLTPLHIAASNGQATMVRSLLDAGARRDVRDERGRTPADVAQPNVAEQLRP
ncbi:ankyrin repeat domain-containing protein [Geodermatophilus sp. SYSU D00710]